MEARINGASTNKSAITIVTTTIAGLAFLCVLTVCVISYMQREVPKDLGLITTGLVGGLLTMLTKTSPTETPKAPNPDAPAPVTVMNPASDPVPTTEQKIDKPFGL